MEEGEVVDECEIDLSQDCDLGSLFLHVGFILPCVVALFILLWVYIWPCLRCCGTAGSCAATDTGCCCHGASGVDEEKRVQQAYYSKSVAHPFHPCWAKWVLPSVSVVLLFFAIWQGFEAQGVITDVTDALIYGMHTETDAFFEAPELNITDLLQRNGSYFITEGGLDTQVVADKVYSLHTRATEEINTMHDNIRSRPRDTEEVVEYILLVIAIPYVLCLLALVFAGCGRNYSPYGNGLTYAWIIFTGHIVVAVWLLVAALATAQIVSSDLCTEIDGLQDPSAPKGLLQVGVTDDMCPRIQATGDRIRNALRQQGRRLCDVLLPRCADDGSDPDRFFNCSSLRLVERCATESAAARAALATADEGPQWRWPGIDDVDALPSVEELRDIVLASDVAEALRGNCSNTSCSILECSTQCEDTLRTISELLTKIIDEGDNIGQYLVHNLELLICDTLRGALWRASRPSCTTLTDNVDQRFNNVLLSAVCLTIAMLAASLGIKRWVPRDEAAKAESVTNEPARHRTAELPQASEELTTREMQPVAAPADVPPYLPQKEAEKGPADELV
eukprot:TRINITY_DN2310_c0_g5_i2.p1 TRINITY_DN2310_c0_g5~~TRINITY_DN2310_c0_g5_i2.p1  ORF type:complete len:618 (+),score=219.15 TRINITY_DN2310_c0_g5_i2:166-1854(+)